MECVIKNLSVNYEIFGEGKPVIMLHGYWADNRLMSGCLEPVFNNKVGYKRIYIDLPGMGKTEGKDWIINSDIMLDIIIAFIEKIIPNQNFLLAGQSYGGYLSRGVIYRIPDRVDGLLLICPLIEPNRKKRIIPQHCVLVENNKLLSKLDPSDVEDFKELAIIQSEKTFNRFMNEIIPAIRIADKGFLTNLLENGFALTFDVDKLNEKFNKPTLILLGRQDSCVGYKNAWDIMDNYPRATFAVLDKSGHNLQLEQEEVFYCLVSEWLTRVEQE